MAGDRRRDRRVRRQARTPRGAGGRARDRDDLGGRQSRHKVCRWPPGAWFGPDPPGGALATYLCRNPPRSRPVTPRRRSHSPMPLVGTCRSWPCRSCAARILDLVVGLHGRRQAEPGDGWLDPCFSKIVYVLTCRILSLVTVPCRGDKATAAEALVLRDENAVLRRQAGRYRYERRTGPGSPHWPGWPTSALGRGVPAHTRDAPGVASQAGTRRAVRADHRALPVGRSGAPPAPSACSPSLPARSAWRSCAASRPRSRPRGCPRPGSPRGCVQPGYTGGVSATVLHARLMAAAPGLARAEGEARGQITLAFAGMTAALNEQIRVLDAEIGRPTRGQPGSDYQAGSRRSTPSRGSPVHGEGRQRYRGDEDAAAVAGDLAQPGVHRLGLVV